MKDILEELKRNLDFHESQARLHRYNPKMNEFHKGAVMAFSKCQVLLDHGPHNKALHITPKAEPGCTCDPSALACYGCRCK